MPEPSAPTETLDFVRESVAEDLRAGRNGGKVATRFPPEPNGYLHIGHAKSICLNFGIASEFGGKCNLRFDDTNPATEDVEYVRSIKEDVRWLGFDWEGREYYASDYFEKLYGFAAELIRRGLAYVCELSSEEIAASKGTATEPGTPSPWRDRPSAESLELFERMRRGEFPDGSRVLRAKIDMASPNFQLRDPVLYRIKKASHHRTGDRWCLYPMYDFAHGLSDAVEGITHSICTLEFEDHRPLYDWILENVSAPCRPRQIEFARLNLTHTVLSKRKLLQLVESRKVSGWDDPRMPTLSGLRRRGFTPESIREFCRRVGVSKVNSVNELGLLEHCVRDDLNKRAPRVLAVLDPLKVVLENFPEGRVEELTAVNNPEDASMGSRKVPFSRVLYIERGDFSLEPPPKFYRLAPGREVRLRYACIIKCVDEVKDENGRVTEVRCRLDPESWSGLPGSDRKVKATIHWVSAAHAFEAEVRLFEPLFTLPEPDQPPDGKDFADFLNPASMTSVRARLEPSLRDAAPGAACQFERLGYFCADPKDSAPGRPVFNRTVTLRDAWARVDRGQAAKVDASGPRG